MRYLGPHYSYRPSYHTAINYLINNGTHAATCRSGRNLIAVALWELRQTRGRQSAQRERRHMLQLCGRFPVKDRATYFAASNGGGRLRWFAAQTDRPYAPLRAASGRIRRFGSFETARAAAAEANRCQP